MKEPASPPLTPELMARDIARLRAQEILRAQNTAGPPLVVYEGVSSEEPQRFIPAIDREAVEADIGEQYLSGAPPSAAELGISVDDFPPARAELLRIEAWRIRTASEIIERQSWETTLTDRMRAPAATEAALAELRAGEKASLISRIRSGLSPTAAAETRSEERAKLEAQLLSKRHDADVAAEALAAVRHDVAVLQRRCEVLEDRREEALAAALREIAEPEARRSVMRLELLAERIAAHVEAYQADAAEWHTELVKLTAIDKAAGLRPRFGLNVEPPDEPQRIELNVHEVEIAQASAPSRDALQKLRENPRVELKLSQTEEN